MNAYLDWLQERQFVLLRWASEILLDPAAHAEEKAVALDALDTLWLQAADVWIVHRCGDLLDSMKKLVGDPPAEIKRLIEEAPRRPRGPPPKPGATPETVVLLVRDLALYGIKFRSSGDARGNPAMVAAGAVLNLHPESVARLYKKVPRQRREEIRRALEQTYEILFEGGEDEGEEALRLRLEEYGWFYQYAREKARDAEMRGLK